MKIGIDLDEVLADFLPALIEYHNATYRTSLVRGRFRTYRFWEIWGGTREEAIQRVYDFHKTAYFKNMKPVVGSQEAIDILKRNNDLMVVTSRTEDVAETTREWIAQHFPNIFSGIYFANHYSQSGSPRTKKEICNSEDIDLLIEDSLEYALECLTPQRKVLLLDCPWNSDSDLPQGIYRVNSWKEIPSSISGIPCPSETECLRDC